MKLKDIMIPDRCTAVDCCITLPSFRRNVNVFVDLDSCDYRLSVGIEKIHLNFSLVDYQWGTLQQYSLVGVVVTPLVHIILIPSQPVFARSP
jgi:hypothetical protein